MARRAPARPGEHLVGDDLPHRVHHGVVVHIQRQGQWRGDDGPGAEVGTRFEEGQTWWLSGIWWLSEAKERSGMGDNR